MLSCPNCGGNLKFDIPSQQLSCEHCHTLFDPYDFDGKTSDAEESKTFDGDYEVTIFTCPQCGGEILSTDNAAAGFCSFCGASTILYSRISHEKRPNYIIPFQKTKEQCKEAYARRMKHSIFAPKELRDPSYIDSFRGIYMPYWAFYISQKGSLSLNGKKTSRRGDYIITDHYALTGDLDAYYKGLSYDASSSFDDNISEELAPYNLKGMKAFTPAYLSGFYADTSDVDAKVYQGDAEYTASAETTGRIASDGTFAGFTMDTIRPEQLHTKTETIDSTMFPVWFLSYRKKDRVAYATVNGQTGLVVADIPIDPKRYLLGSLLLAIPIFALLAWSADKCEIQLSYAIGVAQPTSVMVDTFGTGKIADDELVKIVRENFDLRPAGIIKMLDLRRPIYRQTAAYGHFGRNDLNLPWEATNKAEALKKYL